MWQALDLELAFPLPSHMFFTQTSDLRTVISISVFQLSKPVFEEVRKLARGGLVITRKSRVESRQADSGRHSPYTGSREPGTQGVSAPALSATLTIVMEDTSLLSPPGPEYTDPVTHQILYPPSLRHTDGPCLAVRWDHVTEF